MPALADPWGLRDPVDLLNLMRLKQLSAYGLADRAGVRHSTIYRLLNRQRPRTSLDTATRIADALDVRVEVLFRPVQQNGSPQPAN